MDIVETLLNIAKQEGVVDCCLDDLKAGDGQGYMGSINFVHLNGKAKCGKEKQLNFMIKTATTNGKLREFTITNTVFEREIRMYKIIFPALYNFEKGKGIENPFSSVPRCYYASERSVPEILILEDLIQSGYRSWNRALPISDKPVRIVVQEYARFHAVSFAVQDQNPLLFKELTKNFDNIFDIFMKYTGVFHAAIRKSKLALASLDPNSKAFTRYKQFLCGVEDKYSNLIATCDKYRVILHGDSWCNNMLFKYNKDCNSRNEPVAVRFIDFQFSRLGSPVCDLAYFLYGCTSKEVLDNMNVYKNLYYDTLCRHIELLGSKPDNVYPLPAFEEHWRTYSKFGLIASGLLVFLLLSEKHEIIDFTDIAEAGREVGTAFDYEIANINEFNNRMKHIIEYFVDNNLIYHVWLQSKGGVQYFKSAYRAEIEVATNAGTAFKNEAPAVTVEPSESLDCGSCGKDVHAVCEISNEADEVYGGKPIKFPVLHAPDSLSAEYIKEPAKLDYNALVAGDAVVSGKL
ncbi:hypothetical protein ILUMI_10195, partial [Ignelater luminosus]